MAQTKVKLVSDGVITVDNLHTNHGITTDHVGEGSVLYYTDARVQSYLTTNNYITNADVANLETLTSLSLAANTLSYVDEAGNTTNLDLSLYLDDTNLARLVSGTLDGATGIATFVRDDATTFTVDLSSLTPSETDPVFTASAASGITSTNITNWDTAYGWGDHASVGYLTSFTETDPTVPSHVKSITTTNVSNWDTAYSWGNHASAGYLTSFTETDPTVPSHVKSITTTNISNWNTAYGWGDHSSVGYLTSLPSHTHVWTDITDRPTALSLFTNDAGFITSFTETDPTVPSHVKSITSTNVSNWDTAYGWGNHASAGYLTSFTETDPTVPSHVKAITTTKISNWDTAFGWGNHAGLYLPLSGGTLNVNASSTITITSAGTNASFIHAGSGDELYLGGNGTWQMRFSSGNVLMDNGGYLQVNDSVRSSIFYDSNNTAFYVDPASTSNFNDASFGLGSGNSNQGIQISYGNYASGYGRIRFYQDGSNHQTIHSFSNSWQGGTLQSSSSGAINIAGNNGVTFGGWNIPDMWIDSSGNAQSRGSMRAPIFYDSNNTGYYFDGSSTGDSIRVAGDIVAYYSDERLKDIKGNIQNPIDKVKQLNGFYYTPNETAQKLGYKKQEQVGLSAQEVEKVLPQIIRDAPIGQGYKTLDYSKVVPLLIEAIKDQQQQIEELKLLINK